MPSETEQITLEEAFAAFECIRELYEKWALATLHLNVAAVLLCDDINKHPGYMSYLGKGERLDIMFDHVKKVRELTKAKSDAN